MNLPKASVPTEPGNTCKAPSVAFRLVGTSGPTVSACTFQVNPVTVFTGKTVFSPPLPRLKFTDGGAAALICSRMLRSVAVALSVVKTLAAAMSFRDRPSCSSTSLVQRMLQAC